MATPDLRLQRLKADLAPGVWYVVNMRTGFYPPRLKYTNRATAQVDAVKNVSTQV
jgi:hypothetical protein